MYISQMFIFVDVFCILINIFDSNDTFINLFRSYNGSYYVLVANLGTTLATYTSQNMFVKQGLDMDYAVVAASINSDYQPG